MYCRIHKLSRAATHQIYKLFDLYQGTYIVNAIVNNTCHLEDIIIRKPKHVNIKDIKLFKCTHEERNRLMSTKEK